MQLSTIYPPARTTRSGGNNINNTATQINIPNEQNGSQTSIPKQNINDIDQLAKELGIIHLIFKFITFI